MATTPSIAMIPSGYKDEKVYSVLPTNGDGDFTFARTSTATRVNSNGLIEEVGINKPRLDYSDGACPSLLLEPTSTNKIQYSNDLSQTVWDGDIGDSVYGQAGFNGTNDAWLYTKTLPTNSGFYNQSFTGTYTVSFFVKKEVNKGIQIYNFGDTNQFSKINLENGTYISGVNTVKIEEYSNNWFRVSQTLTVSNGKWYFYITDGVGNAIASSLIVQYFQIEEQSYATSYIKNEGTVAGITRAADSANGSGDATVINSTEGTLYFEGSALADEVLDRVISLSDGTLNNFVSIGYSRFTGYIVAEIFSGGFLQNTNWGAQGITQANNNKFALSWGGGTMKFYVNGTETNTEPATSPIALNVLDFTAGDGNLPMFSNTKDLRVYTTALSDEELTTLTTI